MHHFTSNPIALHDSTSHRITSPLHLIAGHRITSRHITHHITSQDITPRHIIPHHITAQQITTTATKLATTKTSPPEKHQQAEHPKADAHNKFDLGSALVGGLADILQANSLFLPSNFRPACPGTHYWYYVNISTYQVMDPLMKGMVIWGLEPQNPMPRRCQVVWEPLRS